MIHKVDVRLTDKSLDDAIAKLEKYRGQVESKIDEFEIKLATRGADEAFTVFGHNATFQIPKIENGHALVVEGKEVYFLEFGAGFYATTNEAHPFGDNVSIKIAPGSYSEEHAGTFQTWQNSGAPEEDYPFNKEPRYGMVRAYNEMLYSAKDVAKEVFK